MATTHRYWTAASLLALSLAAVSVPGMSYSSGTVASTSLNGFLHGANQALPTAQILKAWHVGPLAAVTPAAQAKRLVNRALPARTWWADASPALTLQSVALNGTIAHLQTWQQLAIDAIWTNPNPAARSGNSEPVWHVDSPDVLLTPGGFQSLSLAATLPKNVAKSQWILFQASKPGVYVVQARWNHTNSVPLVITVGESRLPKMAPLPSLPPQDSGVATVAESQLTLDRPDTELMHQANAGRPGLMRHIWVGRPVRGWLPLAGQVPARWLKPGWDRSVTITLTSQTSGDTTTYLLPVNAEGAFSGIVASPYHGPVMLIVGPGNYTATASAVYSASAANAAANWGGIIEVPQAATINPQLTALASVDYELPGFRRALEQAATLWYNAPDPESGTMAISNWVATHIAYNYQEDRQISGAVDRWPVGATVDETWQTKSGVCENYAQVLVAMLRALGVPAVVEDGAATTKGIASWTFLAVETLQVEAEQQHAWVTVNGIAAKPVVTDPTWDGGSPPSLADANVLVNDFTTSTRLFSSTHHATGPELSGAIFP